MNKEQKLCFIVPLYADVIYFSLQVIAKLYEVSFSCLENVENDASIAEIL